METESSWYKHQNRTNSTNPKSLSSESRSSPFSTSSSSSVLSPQMEYNNNSVKQNDKSSINHQRQQASPIDRQSEQEINQRQSSPQPTQSAHSVPNPASMPIPTVILNQSQSPGNKDEPPVSMLSAHSGSNFKQYSLLSSSQNPILSNGVYQINTNEIGDLRHLGGNQDHHHIQQQQQQYHIHDQSQQQLGQPHYHTMSPHHHNYQQQHVQHHQQYQTLQQQHLHSQLGMPYQNEENSNEDDEDDDDENEMNQNNPSLKNSYSKEYAYLANCRPVLTNNPSGNPAIVNHNGVSSSSVHHILSNQHHYNHQIGQNYTVQHHAQGYPHHASAITVPEVHYFPSEDSELMSKLLLHLNTCSKRKFNF